MSVSDLVLGLDGGGTSTTAWLAETSADGRILGRGKAGPSNAKAVPVATALASLDQAIEKAFADASQAPQEVAALCLGLAGFDRPEDRSLLREWSEARGGAKQLVLVNDGDLVIAAGTPEGWGVGVIGGTGSIAVARSADGRKARAGGWGYIMGDEGSAFRVSLAALNLTARRLDGRSPRPDPDPLTALLCRVLGIAGPEALVSTLYEKPFDRAALASLAPAVLNASTEDPEIERRIFVPAGEELAEMAGAAARGIGIEGGPLPLGLAGSFLLAAEPVARALQRTLESAGYEVQARHVSEPAWGAVILARKALAS